ncbi:hypothetical protein CONPUDRAFT_156960 [Coniophora puteana RWD-64-598 SS2]|uniref:Uncharacterized protein n=1 Tax=Coniophora puteana (strain RWD-64-598) TaxID=741705 RepID=A0A5M3MGM6_CONPW|nr:uncharacterized protein CONPUDRAFT_156960 [Coniophora puteana RWD-64-598 SS2]EIW77775.1 hypothetical protein CONPUDRAFT_156960 [Coniophora puteana RWD-64-598 SS2]
MARTVEVGWRSTTVNVDQSVQEDREKEIEAIENDPMVLIASGGWCGLMGAAGFRRMGVRALVIEKVPCVDNV